MLIAAYQGEFGLKIKDHVPRVYAMGPGHTIEIEEGEEALYPLAQQWKVIPRAADAKRVKPPTLTGPVQRFQPEPHVRRGIGPFDVVIAPRKRAYGASKNWDHWPRVAVGLQRLGLRVFAGGVADASDTRVTCDAGWYYARPLDATIEAIRGAKLVLAACSGLAHLAMLCGTPLLMFSYRGMVAPGPVINSSGQFVSADYWPVRWQRYYMDANHMNAKALLFDGWESPATVVEQTVNAARTW